MFFVSYSSAAVIGIGLLNNKSATLQTKTILFVLADPYCVTRSQTTVLG